MGFECVVFVFEMSGFFVLFGFCFGVDVCDFGFSFGDELVVFCFIFGDVFVV